MKMTQAHFEIIKSGIGKVLANHKNAVMRYEHGDFANANKVKDINKRFRWDLFHAAGLTKFACDELYMYLTDDQIDTALRRITPTIERKY